MFVFVALLLLYVYKNSVYDVALSQVALGEASSSEPSQCSADVANVERGSLDDTHDEQATLDGTTEEDDAYVSLQTYHTNVSVNSEHWTGLVTSLQAKLIHVALNFIMMAYIVVAKHSIEMLNCETQVDLDTGATVRYLKTAPQINCDTAEYTRMHTLAVFTVIVYVVAFPLLLLAFLGKIRHLWFESTHISPEARWWSPVVEPIHGFSNQSIHDLHYIFGFQLSRVRASMWFWPTGVGILLIYYRCKLHRNPPFIHFVDFSTRVYTCCLFYECSDFSKSLAYCYCLTLTRWFTLVSKLSAVRYFFKCFANKVVRFSLHLYFLGHLSELCL